MALFKPEVISFLTSFFTASSTRKSKSLEYAGLTSASEISKKIENVRINVIAAEQKNTCFKKLKYLHPIFIANDKIYTCR